MKFLLPSLIALLFFFQNCGNDVGFSNDVAASSVAINGDLGNGDTADIGVINETCDTLNPQTKTINIKFPKPTKTCEWGINGNLSVKDAFFRARIEEKKTLGLPRGAVICDASFDFKPQPFQYDDYFALLFNNNIITSGYDFRSNLQPQNFGLLNYDWNDLKVGQSFDLYVSRKYIDFEKVDKYYEEVSKKGKYFGALIHILVLLSFSNL